ncbi:MAG: glutamyl-tRNA amidotransferase [Marinilabiliales bacterium]|nr:MAG: glutamyl-tRNA amidotransferase [Marinilabiliales bacterium]
MSLEEKINQDIKQAMLSREKDKLEALRAIKTALLVAKTEKGASDSMSEDAEIKILQRLVKQRKESATIFEDKNRKELAQKEWFEASIIEKYLPEQMSEEEVKLVIKKIIEQTGAESMADMGKVMGMAQKELAGKADGKMIANTVKSSLSK